MADESGCPQIRSPALQGNVRSGLDRTQHRHMDQFNDLQLDIEQLRCAEVQRRIDEQQARAEDVAMHQPQPPPPADAAVEFDGDDRMCAICRENFERGGQVARLRCRHIPHRKCNIAPL